MSDSKSTNYGGLLVTDEWFIGNRSCTDVDECEEYKDRGGLCVGLCVNEPGSYSCQCPEGYRLSADKRTCQGTHFSIQLTRGWFILM